MEQLKKITIEDRNYPKALRKIPNPPKTLYFKGRIKPDELCFAIVGTRRCSVYGKRATLEIAGELAETGVVIVSGLAPGIDTFSHQAAVERKKRTIAVLGTGIDEKSIYPKENIKLAREIVKLGGCLISEYPPGTPGSRFSFPKRNRIISGLSKGVLVIEAKEKSGSLITANYASLQKRKIFALPGPIYSPNSQGPHLLIKRGAKLIDSANDILKELNLTGKIFRKKKIVAKSIEEKVILSTLKEEALHIDKIVEKTKLAPSVVARLLTVLEIEEKVKNLGGSIYTLLS